MLIQVVYLNESVVQVCQRYAGSACLGGKSNIRGTDRAAKLEDDQLAGQLGNAALSLYLNGTIAPYCEAREIADAEPSRGDSGMDLPLLRVDVKTSVMRGYQANPLHYHLAVRPQERHTDAVYVLGLISEESFSRAKFGMNMQVYLAGWMSNAELPRCPEVSGVFEGALVVKAARLRQLMPMPWLSKVVVSHEVFDA